MSFEAKAEALMADAEKMVKSASGFLGGLFGGGSDKIEDAADKFSRAGNAFKASKKWADAAKAYTRSGECYNRVKSEHEAATSYIEAARCWIKAGDARMGTEVLETEALPRIVDAGRLSQAAKLHNEVAEMCEQEGAYQEAIRHFQEAADLFSAENAASTSLKCITRIAHLSAQMDPPDLGRSAEMFEKVGTESLNSNLLKFGAKSAFFNSVICTLARGDVVSGERDLERFKELDYTFPGCRECKLLEDVVQAWKDMSSDAFTDAVFNYDAISKLDPWRTSVLLKIKNQIGKADGAGGEGGEDGVDLT